MYVMDLILYVSVGLLHNLHQSEIKIRLALFTTSVL